MLVFIERTTISQGVSLYTSVRETFFGTKKKQNLSYILSTDESINQSINQSIDRSLDRSIDQSFDRPLRLAGRPEDRKSQPPSLQPRVNRLRSVNGVSRICHLFCSRIVTHRLDACSTNPKYVCASDVRHATEDLECFDSKYVYLEQDPLEGGPKYICRSQGNRARTRASFSPPQHSVSTVNVSGPSANPAIVCR